MERQFASFFKGLLPISVPASWVEKGAKLAHGDGKAAFYSDVPKKWFILWVTHHGADVEQHVEVCDRLPEGFVEGSCPYSEPYNVARLFGTSSKVVRLDEYVSEAVC